MDAAESTSTETDTQSRLEWIAALDQLEALKPKAEVAGHKAPENNDDPRIIAETKQYLHDFNRLNAATADAANSTTPCLSSIPIASIPVRFGAR